MTVTEAALAAAFPGARLVVFGHLGDGNLHYNLSAPAGAAATAFIEHAPAVNRIVHDLVHAMAHSPGVLKCKVVRFNPMPAPSKQRVLIELCGQWPSDYSPMEGPDFELINANEVSLVS